MKDDSEARSRRAAERRSRIVISKTTLEESDIDRDPVDGAEAVSLAAELTRQAWAISGRPFPNYTRSEIPVRFTNSDDE